ncbi:ipis-1-like isoform X2 [Dermacentor albipictus]|uniref:ipis-1-like isoform X2 n=1 Tax=Dermacentor albipictus TaxID=60249 RepID=UPI0031FD0EB8
MSPAHPLSRGRGLHQSRTCRTKRRRRLPPPLTPDVEASVSRGVLQLGIDLLRELRRSEPGEPNVVLSPYAAASALEELLVGSRGMTAAQISAALYIPPGQRVSYYFENCDREMPNRRRSDITRRFDMGYLNNVHHEQTLATIDPDTQASEVLRLERFSWDFAKAPEESRQGIDHYARLYSNAFEAAEILPQGCITPSSLVCMVSVVEFRGSWKQAFDDRTATRETFYESDGSFTPVVMVHQTGRFRLAKCTDLRATAIELPYELPGNRQGTEPSRSSVSTPRSGIVTPACVDAYVGPEFSLVVLLPEEKNGLELLESKLSAFTAMTCFDHLRAEKEVRVSLPLFKVKQVTDMIPLLGAIGVRHVFTEDAELWGSTTGEKRVTLMQHAAAFETAQTGGRPLQRTKPAGLLRGLVHGFRTLVKVPRQRAQFTVDRPFAFFVTCARPHALMLLGSVRRISS